MTETKNPINQKFFVEIKKIKKEEQFALPEKPKPKDEISGVSATVSNWVRKAKKR